MNTPADNQPNTSPHGGYVDCEKMRGAILGAYERNIVGISGDLQIRAAIVQTLRETKVASRILEAHFDGGPSPDEKFFPSQVNVKLQPAHHEVDRVLDERLQRFLGSIPTVELYNDAPHEEELWVVSRRASRDDASVDTVVTRDVQHTEIDGEPREIVHYGIEHHFRLSQENS